MLAILQEIKTVFMNALFITYAFFITTVSANEVVFKGHSEVYCDGNMPNMDLPNIQTTSYGCTPLSISYELTISTLLSEPVFRCNVTWDFYEFVTTDFHYSDSLLKAYPDIYPQTYRLKVNESRIKPYDLEFWVNVNVNGGMNARDILVKCDPGILGKQRKASFNTAWSTNWDKTFLIFVDSKYLSHAEAKKFAKQLFKDAKDKNKDPYIQENYFIQNLVYLSKLKFNSSEIDQLAIKQYRKLNKRERKATSTNKVDGTHNSSDDFWSSSSEGSSQTNAADNDFWSSSEPTSSGKVDQGGDFWSGGDDGSLYAFQSTKFYDNWVAEKKKELNSRTMPHAESVYKSDLDDSGYFVAGIKNCFELEFISNNTHTRRGSGPLYHHYEFYCSVEGTCPIEAYVEKLETKILEFKAKNNCPDKIIVRTVFNKFMPTGNSWIDSNYREREQGTMIRPSEEEHTGLEVSAKEQRIFILGYDEKVNSYSKFDYLKALVLRYPSN